MTNYTNNHSVIKKFKIAFTTTLLILFIFSTGCIQVGHSAVPFFMIPFMSSKAKIEISYGKFDRLRGGMGVIPIDENFSKSDLKIFYNHINNKSNNVLSNFKYAVAIIRQSDGGRRISLNSYPRLRIENNEYSTITTEISRQFRITKNARE